MYGSLISGAAHLADGNISVQHGVDVASFLRFFAGENLWHRRKILYAVFLAQAGVVVFIERVLLGEATPQNALALGSRGRAES